MMMESEYKLHFAGIVLVALVIEMAWSFKNKNGVYNLTESSANFGIFIGNNLLKPISLAWKYLVFEWFATFQIFHISVNAFTVVLTFLAAEFVFYWYHRLSHETPLLWALHHTHHSGMQMNLTTAVRLNWLGAFIGPLFYIPLVLLGLSPEVLIICITLGLFLQYFLHTKAVKKFGFFEGKFFNTPSAHRVHHGSNEKYIDKNYGGTLIVFDRLFGTYQQEEEKVIYGVTTGFYSNNPLILNFKPLIEYLRNR